MSWPGSSRPSTSLLLQGRKTWMPAHRRARSPAIHVFAVSRRDVDARHKACNARRPHGWPGMTAERLCANATHHPASAIQHSLMAGHSRPKDGVLSHAYVPASQITDSHFKQPSSNSQFQTAKRHHPYCLARPRVGPSSRCLPSKMRGMARQVAQPLFFVCPHSLSEIRGAARRAIRTCAVGYSASFLRRRAALFVAARETRDGLRQPSSWRAAPIGRQAEPRRRPGACLAGHARGRRIRSHPA